MAETRVPRRRLAKKKPSERAILATVENLVIPETGESVVGFVPMYPLDRRMLAGKGLAYGSATTIDVFADRNPRFWRKFHAMALFVADNVDDFEGLNAHDVLKKIQLAAKVHCEQEIVEADQSVVDALAALGVQAPRFWRWKTKSLNFMDTDEIVAGEVWKAICDYVIATYFPSWDQDQIDDACTFWERETA